MSVLNTHPTVATLLEAAKAGYIEASFSFSTTFVSINIFEDTGIIASAIYSDNQPPYGKNLEHIAELCEEYRAYKADKADFQDIEYFISF
jgi:hypothetical protein